MTNPNQTAAFGGFFGNARFTLPLAGLLISLGGALQLGVLGHGSLRPANLWMFSVIAPNIWNTLTAVISASYWLALEQFWPLILVATGVGVLLFPRRRNRSGQDRSARKGQSHV